MPSNDFCSDCGNLLEKERGNGKIYKICKYCNSRELGNKYDSIIYEEKTTTTEYDMETLTTIALSPEAQKVLRQCQYCDSKIISQVSIWINKNVNNIAVCIKCKKKQK